MLYDDKSMQISVKIPTGVDHVDVNLLFQSQNKNSQFVLDNYVNETIEKSALMKKTLINLLRSKEDRDNINVPGEVEIIASKNKWTQYGDRLFAIPELLAELPELHEKYINIVKNTYFYYKAKKNYYSGKPTFTDSQYDYLMQNRIVRNDTNCKSINVNN